MSSELTKKILLTCRRFGGHPSGVAKTLGCTRKMADIGFVQLCSSGAKLVINIVQLVLVYV